MTDHHPSVERGRLLWTGEAAGDHWELELVSIDEGPLYYPEPERDEIVEGSHAIRWGLLLVSRKGERIVANACCVTRRLSYASARGFATVERRPFELRFTPVFTLGTS